MTANQISYANYLEDRRHNLASENETQRHNVSQESLSRQDIQQRAADNAASRELTARDIANREKQTAITSYDTGYDFYKQDSTGWQLTGTAGAVANKLKPVLSLGQAISNLFGGDKK